MFGGFRTHAGFNTVTRKALNQGCVAFSSLLLVPRANVWIRPVISGVRNCNDASCTTLASLGDLFAVAAPELVAFINI